MRVRGYGLGWGVRTDCDYEHVVWHNGVSEGYASSILMLPRHGVGVVVLANSSNALVREIAQEVIDILSASGGLQKRTLRASPGMAAAIDRVLAAVADELKQGEVEIEADAAAELEWLRSEVGPCTEGRRTIFSATSAEVEVECEKANAWIELSIRSSRDPSVVSARVGLRGVDPPPAVSAVAQSIATLVNEWRGPLYDDVFSPRFTKTGMRRWFSRLSHRLGSCDSVEPVASYRGAAGLFSFNCERRAASVRISLSKAAKVEDIMIEPVVPTQSACWGEG